MTVLGLGTAQFGLEGYGISSAGGRPTHAEAVEILTRARSFGFRAIDTGPHYGEAETIVGDLAHADLAIVTRTPPFLGELGPDAAGRAVRDGFERSLAALSVDRVHGLLVHSTADLLGPCGTAIFRELERARESNCAARIGCVAYTADELDRLRARFPIEIVQVPLNVLDQRLIASGHLVDLAASGVEVHVRSVFLQGLLLMDPDALPPGMERARDPLSRFRRAADEHGWTPLEAALGFALARREIDVTVVGVQSLAHLDAIGWAAAEVSVDADALTELATTDPLVIDPTRWPKES